MATEIINEIKDKIDVIHESFKDKRLYQKLITSRWNVEDFSLFETVDLYCQMFIEAINFPDNASDETQSCSSRTKENCQSDQSIICLNDENGYCSSEKSLNVQSDTASHLSVDSANFTEDPSGASSNIDSNVSTTLTEIAEKFRVAIKEVREQQTPQFTNIKENGLKRALQNISNDMSSRKSVIVTNIDHSYCSISSEDEQFRNKKLKLDDNKPMSKSFDVGQYYQLEMNLGKTNHYTYAKEFRSQVTNITHPIVNKVVIESKVKPFCQHLNFLSKSLNISECETLKLMLRKERPIISQQQFVKEAVIGLRFHSSLSTDFDHHYLRKLFKERGKKLFDRLKDKSRRYSKAFVNEEKLDEGIKCCLAFLMLQHHLKPPVEQNIIVKKSDSLIKPDWAVLSLNKDLNLWSSLLIGYEPKVSLEMAGIKLFECQLNEGIYLIILSYYLTGFQFESLRKEFLVGAQKVFLNLDYSGVSDDVNQQFLKNLCQLL